MKPWTGRTVTLGIVGLALTIIGCGLCFVWPVLFNKILGKELPVTPNSRVFDLWREQGEAIPLNMEFYFFNWTNPKELTVPGKKPNLVQVGPYVFKHKAEKVNITFHPENNTVSYDIQKFWYFDPERSNGTLEDRIIQLNVLAVAAANKVRFWTPFFKDSLSIVLDRLSAIHIEKSIDELMFTGFHDKLIEMGKLAASDEEEIPFDKFGWFYMRNGTTFFDGHYNMGTGEDDIHNLGVLKKWNGKDTTNFYKSPCNIVEGSAGEFWPPNREADEIHAFTADLCRPLTYEYTGTATHHGITGYKYELGPKSLGNSSFRHFPHNTAKYFDRPTTTEDFLNADHSTRRSIINNPDPDSYDMGQCYCNGECSPMGVINVTACRYGAPAFVSLPHFLNGDPSLREQVNGMNPNEKEHSFYFLLEPSTGVPIDVAARLQVNILLRPWSFVSLFKNVPKIYFPCFWFSLRAGTTEELAFGLRVLLLLPSIGLYSSIVLAIVGAVILMALAISRFLKNDRSHPKVLPPQSQPPSVRPVGWMLNGDDDKTKKSEIIYMDATPGNDENERNDRQLYPSLT